jgi:Flp pilus assembly protein TadG
MNRLKVQTGSNIVEFALVLPLLLILVSGIVDLGLMIFDKAVITNAAREGARFGMVFGEASIAGGGRPTEAQIIARVNSYLGVSGGDPNGSLVNFAAGAPTVTVAFTELAPPAGNSSGDRVTVTVNFTYQHYVMLITALKGVSTNLSSSSVMRLE